VQRAPFGVVIDPDGVKPAEVAAQRFQPVAWRDAEVLQLGGGVQHVELAQGDLRDVTREISGRPVGDAVE
jgi:hypothetical protein